jgi:4-amino-4-deoxy-L-arabinose transferase-like glycosyltransferase
VTTFHKRSLYAILIAYVVLASIYSSVTPLFEASDELWHYPMVKYLADNSLQLPPQDPTNPGPWRQEGSQPPLYYMLAAALTAGIDTSDMDYVRRINPHADIGVVRPDGNANMVVHRAEAEAFPWRGTTLAIHIIRFFSIGLGLGTVLVTYQLAREIFPEQPSYALGAAALNAFLPMFLFISGSVNNDNLSNLLGNLLTLLVVRLVKKSFTHNPHLPEPLPQPSTVSRGGSKTMWRDDGEGKNRLLRGSQPQLSNFPKTLSGREGIAELPGWQTYAVLGVALGAGLLAKLNLVFFVPLVGVALVVISWRLRNWRPAVMGGVIIGGLSIVIAGWWYWHNWQLYGDPTGINRFLEMVGRRAIPANAAQLWSERHSFTQAYWGFFGGVNVPLPDVVYLIFNIIGGVGLAGAVGFIVYMLARKRWTLEKWLPAAITVIWPLVTFVSFLRWTAETPASQGRLVFGALSAISLWMVVGLVWWTRESRRKWVILGVIGYFGFIAMVAPFWTIGVTYQPTKGGFVNIHHAIFNEPKGGNGQLELRGVFGLFGPLQPEDYAGVVLSIGNPKVLAYDWSLFAHLVTEDGVIVSQRDVYPGGGKLATSDLKAGNVWTNSVAVWVPPAAYAPMKLEGVIGWYNLKTGERMRLADGSETYSVGQVELVPRTDPENLGVPNPIRINFDNQIELVGYELTDLSPAAGDTVELTLYWRGMRKIDKDYKIFANILDTPTLTKYAASDGMPMNWQAPTTTWEPGAIIKDVHTLTIDPNAPPGMYDTEIGWYWQVEDGSLQRLRIVTPDGGMANDFMNLTRVRIVPAGS